MPNPTRRPARTFSEYLSRRQHGGTRPKNCGYACTSSSCDLNFPTKKAWWTHEQTKHGVQWDCTCGKIYEDFHIFESHVGHSGKKHAVSESVKGRIERALRDGLSEELRERFEKEDRVWRGVVAVETEIDDKNNEFADLETYGSELALEGPITPAERAWLNESIPGYDYLLKVARATDSEAILNGTITAAESDTKFDVLERSAFEAAKARLSVEGKLYKLRGNV